MSGKHTQNSKTGKNQMNRNGARAETEKVNDTKPKLSPEAKKIIIALISAFVIILGAAIAATIIISNTLSEPDTKIISAETQPATQGSSAAVSTSSTASASTNSSTAQSDDIASGSNTDNTVSAETEASQKSEDTGENIPAYLAEVLEDNGYDISSLSFGQLIVVDSNDDSAATVSFFEKADDKWYEPAQLSSANGYVGIEGVGQADEESSITPAGLFSISTAFGFNESVDTGIEYFQITEDTYWVDDPNSKYYNMHVEGYKEGEWNSAEHMIEYPLNYSYGFAFDYNTNPIVRGAGSAFFMHVNDHPTQGCVGVPENTMVEVLKWLNRQDDPHILIV